MAFLLAIGLALCLRRCERRGCKQEKPVYLIGRLTSNLGGVTNRKLTRLPGHHCGGRAIILFGRFLLRFEPLGCQFSAFHLFVSPFFIVPCGLLTAYGDTGEKQGRREKYFSRHDTVEDVRL